MLPQIVDASDYRDAYRLKAGILGLDGIDGPRLDINEPGLILHGSEADPYSILRQGIIPHKTHDNKLETDVQVCLGLNSDDTTLTLAASQARKNSAVKYAGYFSPIGYVYVVSKEVKKLRGYREFWDSGRGARGYAWLPQPITPDLILAVVTKNVPRAAAAVLGAGRLKPVYTPQGTGYLPRNL
jgi:hypothetical protein